MAYSRDQKERIIQQLLPPHNRKIAEVAIEEGVSVTSIYQWRREFGLTGGRADAGEGEDELARASAFLTQEEIFDVVLDTARLGEAAFCAYCEAQALAPAVVRQWQENCFLANGQSLPLLAQERQERRRLLRINKRQARELSEMAQKIAELEAKFEG